MAKRAPQRSATPDRKGRREAVGPLSAASAAAPVSAVPPVALPVKPSAEAVTLFESGMQALQSHDYSAARAVFRAVQTSYPRESALCERAIVYAALCERELARRPTEPRTIEERLTAATAALNNADETRAEALAEEVLKAAPQHDLALYLLAAVAARRGNADVALARLARALAVNPEIRAQARHDADFEDLRDLAAFRDLMDAPIPPNSDGRPRRRR